MLNVNAIKSIIIPLKAYIEIGLIVQINFRNLFIILNMSNESKLKIKLNNKSKQNSYKK